MKNRPDMADGDGHGHGLASVTPIHHSVFESTVGQIVARAYRVDPLDHTRDELVRVMDGVRDCMDAKERLDRSGGWHGLGDDSYSARRGRLTEYLRDGGFISDLHEDDDLCRIRVQMSWDEAVTCLAKKTNASKVSRVWLMDQLDWFRLETAVDGGERPGRALAREVGLGLSTVQNLFGFYESAGRCRV